MALASLVAINSLDFQGPPLSMVLVMDLPASNHYVPRHINNRHITVIVNITPNPTTDLLKLKFSFRGISVFLVIEFEEHNQLKTLLKVR
jgi:hypothetical protein